MKERAALAHHEAAHAVLSIAFGLPAFEKVTVSPGEGWAGCVEYGDEKRMDKFWNLMCATGVRLAGGIAQAKYLNTSIAHVAPHMSEDLAQVRDSLKRNNMCAEEAEPFMNWMMMRTTIHVDDRWTIIQKVADELMKRKTLTHAEVKQILGIK